MYDLPDQTLSSWSYSLNELEKLPIQHLSLYNLTIEPHTSFYKRQKSLKLPSQGESLNFLNSAVRKMQEMHFQRYEISAFAKAGFESKHNIGYWTARPFLGFGPSAFSYFEGERFQNISNLKKYSEILLQDKFPTHFTEKLEEDQKEKELLALELRLLKGVKKNPLFSQDLQKSIQKLIQNGLLMEKENRIFLSEKGLLFHDSVASELM